MHRFARIFHRFNHQLKSSARFDKKSAKLVARNAAGFSLASGLVFAERKDGVTKPEKSLTFTDGPLTHQFVLKQASVLSVEAVSRVLTHTVIALQEKNESYCQILKELISIFDMGGDGLPLVMTSQQLYEQMVSLKSQVNSEKKVVQDLHLLFIYVQKLMDAAAETSFLVGADYASVQASERLRSAEREVEKEILEVEKLERELLLAEADHMKRTKVKEEPKHPSEEKPLHDRDIIKEKETLKKVDEVVYEEDIKVTTTPEKSTSFLNEHGEDDIKITVKDENDEDEHETKIESDFSDEEFNFPLHRNEKEDKYKMPTY